MFDPAKDCPVCFQGINDHTVQNFLDCIDNLIIQNKDDSDPTTAFDKYEEAISVINDLLEKTRSMLQECDKDPDKNDLAIKYLLNQKDLLKKLREILFNPIPF